MATVGLWAAVAGADTRPEPVLIEFDAPAACGDEETFLQRVRERTDRFTLTDEGEAARRFTIHITDVKERYGGVLTIDAPGASRQQRDIASHSCSDVVDALAFFTALAIDPKLSSSSDEPEPEAEPEPEVEPLPPLPIPKTEPLPLPKPTREPTWHFGAGAHVAALSGVAPDWLLGGEALLDLTLFPGRVYSQGLRAGARLVRNTQVETTGGVAEFELTIGFLELCPLWVGSAEVGLRLCASGEIGRLTAMGRGVVNPLTAERDWAALSGSLRPTVVLVERLLLEASVGALFPLRRDSFSFVGRPAFHEVETVTFLIAVGVTGWVY